MTRTPLTRDHLAQLGCIQHFSNVASIRQHGILCNHLARMVPHKSVAMTEIQERRAKKAVPGAGRKLHTYANLYINPRNKMMYKVKYENERGDLDICVLRVSLDVLDLPGVVITDCNASMDMVNWGPVPGGFSKIMKEEVFIEYWTHENPIEEQRLGGVVCAEVLVPDRVPPECIVGAYVSTEPSREELAAIVNDPGFPITVNRRVFFR